MKKLLFCILTFSLLLLLPACTVLKLVAGHEMADCEHLAGRKLEDARARFGEPLNAFSPVPVTVTLETPDPQHPLAGKTPKDYNWYLWCFKGGFIEMGALTATSSRSDWIRQTVCYSPNFQSAADRPKVLEHCDQFGTEIARKSYKELQGFCNEIKGRAFPLDEAMQKFGTLVRAHTLISESIYSDTYPPHLTFAKFSDKKDKALIIYAKAGAGSDIYNKDTRVFVDDCEVKYDLTYVPEQTIEDPRECSKIKSIEDAEQKYGMKLYETHNMVTFAKGALLIDLFPKEDKKEDKIRYDCQVLISSDRIQKVIEGRQEFVRKLLEKRKK
jgi:hypothetical protein